MFLESALPNGSARRYPPERVRKMRWYAAAVAAVARWKWSSSSSIRVIFLLFRKEMYRFSLWGVIAALWPDVHNWRGENKRKNVLFIRTGSSHCFDVSDYDVSQPRKCATFRRKNDTGWLHSKHQIQLQQFPFFINTSHTSSHFFKKM